MLRLFVLLLAAHISFLASCADKSVDPAPAGPTTLDVSALLRFDASRNYRLIVTNHYNGHEDFIDGDRIIGEPFIDMNGNGVYDEGIDIFVKSGDPATNMDLNHNGEHDGPLDPWQLGVPYDDYNHNGIYNMPNMTWNAGEAFCDLNGNGRHDLYLDDTLIQIVRPRVDTSATLGIVQEFAILDSIWEFVSDSGYVTCLPKRTPGTWDALLGRPRAYQRTSFRCNDRIEFLGYADPGDTVVLPLFDSLTVPTQSTRVTAELLGGGHAPFEFTRRYTKDELLTIEGHLYENLVRITFDSLTCADSVRADSFKDATLSIWVDLSRGPLAIESNQLLYPADKILIVPLPDTLPLSMSQ